MTLDNIENWRTCCAELPVGLPAALVKKAYVTKVCDGMFSCLLRPDVSDTALEFLCPSCGFLVREMFNKVYRKTYLNDPGNARFLGACPAGKKVALVLIHCPMCRPETKT